MYCWGGGRGGGRGESAAKRMIRGVGYGGEGKQRARRLPSGEDHIVAIGSRVQPPESSVLYTGSSASCRGSVTFEAKGLDYGVLCIAKWENYPAPDGHQFIILYIGSGSGSRSGPRVASQEARARRHELGGTSYESELKKPDAR